MKSIKYLLVAICSTLMIIDLSISYPWDYSVICFYSITLSTLVFRLIPHYIIALILHITLSVSVWFWALVNCILNDYPLSSNPRINYICTWQIFPLLIWLTFSAIVFVILWKHSERHNILHLIHGIFGLYIAQIFFWIACFYIRHSNNWINNISIVCEMLYLGSYLSIMLPHQMVSTQQKIKAIRSVGQNK